MDKVPDIVPLLSAGKHRSAKSGGCFMEIASYLAGDKWSDHPKCVNPSLGELARCVNDVLPDGRRSQLTVMIPSVIGTGRARSTHERALLGATVVRSCTMRALPMLDQKALPVACALVGAERILGARTPAAAAALATQPAAAASAEAWAKEYAGAWSREATYVSHSVPLSIKLTVKGVNDELGPEAWHVLMSMLRDAIGEVRHWCRLDETTYRPIPRQRWHEVRDLLGSAPPDDPKTH
jgi:hypothetical protein